MTEVAPPTYRALDEAKIIGTFERLRNRIGERFPEAGLREVAEELIAVGKKSRSVSPTFAHRTGSH